MEPILAFPGFSSVALLLLAAASSRVELVNEVYRIPAGEWRYVELGLNQKPAYVTARFEALEGSRQVRLALLRTADLERLRNGQPHGVMAVTESAGSGRLEYPVEQPGDYAILVDNSTGQGATIRLNVSLDFSGTHGAGITRLSPRRQLTVILVSFAVFFGIVGWSTRRLLRAIRR
jgi:hypothetical protein